MAARRVTPICSVKTDFFCKIHKKALVLESLFNKDVGQRMATLKKDFGVGIFLWICEIFKNTFSMEPRNTY